MTALQRSLNLATAALLLSPWVLRAQTDPSMLPSSQQQPTQQQTMQQQQQPGATRAGAASAEMQDSAASSGATSQTMKDKIFLRKAAEGGMAEVQLGQLAATKSASEDVKSFGQKMVTDHTQLNDQMRPIAESMGVMLPKKLSGKNQAEYDKLNGLSGDEFDKEYLTFMVKDHHADLREFRMEAANASDPTLQSAVAQGARVIREHTSMVESLARSKGIELPARRERHSPPPVD
jgi:putative membrane protein